MKEEIKIQDIIKGKVRLLHQETGWDWIVDEQGNLIADITQFYDLQKEKNLKLKNLKINFIVDAINEKLIRDEAKDTNNKEIVASIKNKLSPFWLLSDLITLENKDLPHDKESYFESMRDAAIKAVKNQNKIIELLNKIK